jgi:hypothetical protein
VQEAAMTAPLVWYVSFGSNLDRHRLQCYLSGGRPPAALRANQGARDPAPPREDRAITIPHQLFFADVSHVWTGGVAFVDHAPADHACTYARAYLITSEQLSDVIAQESARPLGSVELVDHLDTVRSRGEAVIGPGRYDRLLRCPDLEGTPAVTFTGRTPLHATTLTTPAADYLAMMAQGLRVAHEFDDDTITSYLSACPGIVGAWTMAALREAIDSPPGG